MNIERIKEQIKDTADNFPRVNAIGLGGGALLIRVDPTHRKDHLEVTIGGDIAVYSTNSDARTMWMRPDPLTREKLADIVKQSWDTSEGRNMVKAYRLRDDLMDLLRLVASDGYQLDDA